MKESERCIDCGIRIKTSRKLKSPKCTECLRKIFNDSVGARMKFTFDNVQKVKNISEDGDVSKAYLLCREGISGLLCVLPENKDETECFVVATFDEKMDAWCSYSNPYVNNDNDQRTIKDDEYIIATDSQENKLAKAREKWEAVYSDLQKALDEIEKMKKNMRPL